MLVITLGDPYSINIEMLASLLVSSQAHEQLPWPVVVIGSYWQWLDQTKRAGLPAGSWQAAVDLAAVAAGPGRWFIDCPAPQRAAESLTSRERGALAKASLERLQGFAAPPGSFAVLTAPIEKYACREAGFLYPGQTEFFADLWQAEALMLLAGPRLKVGLATNHLPLAEVPGALTPALVARKVHLLRRCLEDVFEIVQPRLAICGLNPHAGEGGLCGREELDMLRPLIRRLQADLGGEALLAGPLPADTVFWQAYQGQWDGVLALYHDQGLGPLKTVHFDEAVNVSGGLPQLRVSPDHGPARDYFLTGKASRRSFDHAWQLATCYLNRHVSVANKGKGSRYHGQTESSDRHQGSC